MKSQLQISGQYSQPPLTRPNRLVTYRNIFNLIGETQRDDDHQLRYQTETTNQSTPQIFLLNLAHNRYIVIFLMHILNRKPRSGIIDIWLSQMSKKL